MSCHVGFSTPNSVKIKISHALRGQQPYVPSISIQLLHCVHTRSILFFLAAVHMHLGCPRYPRYPRYLRFRCSYSQSTRCCSILAVSRSLRLEIVSMMAECSGSPRPCRWAQAHTVAPHSSKPRTTPAQAPPWASSLPATMAVHNTGASLHQSLHKVTAEPTQT